MLGSLVAEELLLTFRLEVADPREGVSVDEPDSESLWKDAEIYRYMTEACDALARETFGLLRVFQRPITAGQAKMNLPDSIIKIRAARAVVAKRDIKQANLNEGTLTMADDYGVRTFGLTNSLEAEGQPAYYIRDYYGKGTLRLVPIPTADDTLEIEASVTLSYPFVNGTEPIPFTEIADQRLILHYMKYLAYAKQDADVQDLSRSISFKNDFDTGSLKQAGKVTSNRRKPGTTRMAW